MRGRGRGYSPGWLGLGVEVVEVVGVVEVAGVVEGGVVGVVEAVEAGAEAEQEAGVGAVGVELERAEGSATEVEGEIEAGVE